MAKPCLLPAFNSGKKIFLLAHKTFDLALYIVGFVHPVGDTDKLSQAFVFEHLDPFSCFKQECSSLTNEEEDGYDH